MIQSVMDFSMKPINDIFSFSVPTEIPGDKSLYCIVLFIDQI